MNDELDTRARAGATALRDAVRHLPVEAAARRTRAPQRRVALAALAIVAVVALAASLVSRGDDDERLSTDPGGAPRLVLDPPPAGLGTPPVGLSPSGAVDLPLPGETAVQGTYWVYGDAAADDPFAGGDLAVVEVAGPFTGGEDLAPDAEVDGHPAFVAASSDDESEAGLARLTVFVELATSTVGLGSRSLSDADLLEVAEGLDLDARALDPPEELSGLDQIGTARGTLNPGATMQPFPVGVGHLVGYSDDGDRAVSVASVVGGDGALAVARWSFGATARPVEVRGVDGWSGAPFGEGSAMVVWQESPTAVVALSGFGVDEATLLVAAADLRPATDQEWAELLRLSDTATVPPDALVGVSNDDEEGSAFAAYLDAEGMLCLTYDEADGSSSGTCGGSSEPSPLTVSTQRLANGAIVVYGYTTLGTDGELRIETEDGSLAGLSEAFHTDGTLFAGLVTDETLPTEIVVRGTDGTELAREAVFVGSD